LKSPAFLSSPLFAPAAILTIILFNVIAYKLIVHRAIRKYIRPDLNHKNLIYLKHKIIGPLGTGDFNEKNTLTLVSFRGGPRIFFYVYIYYKSPEAEKKVTALVDTIFFVIRKVSYSSEF